MTGAPTVAIVGPTASGKTALSLDLAEALGGEIVNTDAMQVYRGMDIGTAKLPLAERRGITHHLLDTHDVREPATVAAFQGWARAVIAGLRERSVTPVLVGGSALYIRAILDRFDFQPTDADVRARLEAELASLGPSALHERLADLDPRTAATLAPDNGRRVVRALEVIELTGEPYAGSLPELEYADPRTVQVGVDIDRATLDARIEQRVHQMYDAGLVDEVARLLEAGLAEGRTASRAIGYREAQLVLAGELDARRGPAAHRLRDPPLRAPPDGVVAQGPPHHLAALRRRRPARASAGRRGAGARLTARAPARVVRAPGRPPTLA